MKVSQIINEETTVFTAGSMYEGKRPQVSVLLPTYNKQEGGFFLRAALSATEHDFKDIELIIIDDASEDKTTEELAKLMQKDGRISLLRHKTNIGLPALSMYEGFLKARGEYIAFLFDDTMWDKAFIGKTLRYMKYNSLKASFGVLHSYYGTGKDDYIAYGDPALGYDADSLYTKNRIATCSVMLHRSVFEEIGFFDPNLVLTKDYPWDMWLRIADNYEFKASGIFCGNDISVTQRESLARSMSYSRWCIYEQMNKQRELSLEHYPDIHIDEMPLRSSFLFKQLTERRIKECSKKAWFKYFTQCEESLQSHIIRKVLVMAADNAALVQSPFMTFARADENICYNFVLADEVSREDLLYADAVIFIRDIERLHDSVKYCGYLKIPCYLYLDEVYFEQNTAKRLAEENFSDFTAVFVPTEEIREAFDENINALTVKMPFNKARIHDYNPVESGKNVTFAFLGSVSDSKQFAKRVMPVLCELSEKYEVRVVFPDDGIIPKRYSAYKNIVLIPVPRATADKGAFWAAEKYGPQFIIQCTDAFAPITHSALIQAVQLGGVLITSDAKLYGKIGEKVCYLSENDEKAWDDAIQNAVSNTRQHRGIYMNALRFASEYYDMDKSRSAVDKEIFKLKRPEEKTYVRRFGQLYYTALNINKRKINFEELKLSGGIKNMREYKSVSCDTQPVFAVGVIIAPKEEGSKLCGSVKMSLIRRSGEAYTSELELEDIVYNDFTYFKFKPIDGTLGESFSVVFEFTYKDAKQRACIYETQTNRVLADKLKGKLGKTVSGKNVLFADMRGEKTFGQI